MDPGAVERRVGRQVEQHVVQLHPAYAVHARVVHLHDKRDLPVLERVDDPHLPERPPAIELARQHASRERGELVHAARRPERGRLHVDLEVELRYLDPHRPADAERRRGGAVAQQPQLGQAPPDQLTQALDRESVGRIRRIEHDDRRRVHVPRRGLSVQESGIDAAEVSHPSTVAPARRP